MRTVFLTTKYDCRHVIVVSTIQGPHYVGRFAFVLGAPNNPAGEPAKRDTSPGASNSQLSPKLQQGRVRNDPTTYRSPIALLGSHGVRIGTNLRHIDMKARRRLACRFQQPELSNTE